ncbi:MULTISPECIES: MaoC family dehydratase [Dietzia]|jgi:acyl dehydratase|uniref:MaoC family dehydratase n=1 Tax=Dietzia maris TaxID=37915 RepID=A0A365PDK4_9ACTN|nr:MULTISPECIES: MaoC family dehydratase [Dietzia]MBB0991687.1 MaoC family dehydratase [Dietzia sp. SLG510A3-30A2]MBB0993852.1 MaoC family dehydratase [Dietzia sp. SLG510A3-40A3]MBB1009611.1 MaoC family dehydratase [Dietzia sp. SLG510A3-3B2-2]ODQ83583.1 dehydratase [Dietzia alimentaria]MBB0996403.1 MaoC family dehydratase [Dietzia maris]
MKVFEGLEQLEAELGRHVGYSDWMEITQERIDAFAEATGDHQWIHVDPARAAEGPYGRTIAHGYLTLSLLPVLGAEVMEIRGFAMMINYGVDKVRFPAPVPVGSRIRAGIELTSLQRKSSGVQLNSLVTVEVEGSDRPAVVAETVRMMVE